ncbi:MAG: class II fumarate hydratase, partial [Clostridia bacterium]|nr:class II fumarate hydratase [Clostridia bacterium]
MNYRTEHDSMGSVEVPSDALWGAQTQRSLNNFSTGLKDGRERMPDGILSALLTLKKACALANHELKPEKMTDEKLFAVLSACEKAENSEFPALFPLSVYQTGSGTQTNMNVNEVVANIAEKTAGRRILHPNDDVNMSQSTNDLFPSALLIAASAVLKDLIKSISALAGSFRELEEKYTNIVKPGRTHLQDAVPLRFSDEVSGWRGSLERDLILLEKALEQLAFLPVGGTAVGNGANCPEGFDRLVCRFV